MDGLCDEQRVKGGMGYREAGRGKSQMDTLTCTPCRSVGNQRLAAVYGAVLDPQSSVTLSRMVRDRSERIATAYLKCAVLSQV